MARVRIKMDTTKWKSILVPRSVYDQVKELSKQQGRTISGQLRMVFQWYCEAHARRNDDDDAGNR